MLRSLNLSGSCDCVDQVISTYYCLITFNRFLCYCVRISSFSVCTVCWQIVKLIVPAICFCYGLSIVLFAILIQNYSNLFWQYSSFWYVPGLASTYLNLVALCVDQVISIIFLVISCNWLLIDFVSISNSVFIIHWKICKAVLPLIFFCYFKRLVLDSILLQDYGNLFWQCSSLWCFPDLCSFYLHGSCNGVDQIGAVYLLDIAIYFFLVYCISILGLSVVTILRQVIPAICPAIRFRYGLSIVLFAILLQDYSNLFWQCSSLWCLPSLCS